MITGIILDIRPQLRSLGTKFPSWSIQLLQFLSGPRCLLKFSGNPLEISQTPKFTKSPNAALVFPYTIFKVIILTKMVCFTLHGLIAEAYLGAILGWNVFSQIWDFAPLAQVGGRKWGKNTLLYPQKKAHIHKNPQIQKWRFLHGESLSISLHCQLTSSILQSTLHGPFYINMIGSPCMSMITD